MEYTTINVTETDGIAVIQLNRPSKCNAINAIMMRDLLAVWQLASNADWRCIVLTGAGERAFCAGADLQERQGLSTAKWREQHAILQQAMRAMVACPIPIIGAINGAAYGGGLELTLACDFAYCADHAVFSQSEVHLGIMPGAMGTQYLPQAVGLRRAKELALSAVPFTAESALSYGLVNAVYPAADLLNASLASAQRIAAQAPLAVRSVKAAINHSDCSPILEGYAREVDLYNALLDTRDRVEGITAFNEKRTPQFKGG